MEKIFVRYIRLPSTVYGVTVKDENGDFNIYINESLSSSGKEKAVAHEMKHIKRGDFYSDEKIDVLENDLP